MGQRSRAGQTCCTLFYPGALTKAIAGAVGNAAQAEHLTQLRQRVRAQRADVLDRQGKHSEAQSLRATQ
jgi:hypothetical protein